MKTGCPEGGVLGKKDDQAPTGEGQVQEMRWKLTQGRGTGWMASMTPWTI